MITREQIEAIRAAMVAPIIWAIIGLLLLAALIPLGKKCKAELRSMVAACREGGLKKFFQYLFVGWCISVAMYVSAVKPNDSSSHPAPQRAPIHRPVEQDEGEESDAGQQPLPPLRITEVERTDDAVSGTLDWDGTDDIQGATTIDVFVAHPVLTNEFRWVKAIEVSGPVSNCPWSVSTNELGVAEMPVALFVKITERISSSSSMVDKDGDLLPGIYELRHGTNPYVPDFDQVSRTTLGPSVTQSSLQSVLNASAPYDLISLPENGTRIESGVSMPPHPVMIVGPTNGYARIETSANPYAFVLQHGQNSHMLFQNLYLNMLPDDDLQVGFWCGSDLPIGVAKGTPGASGTFRNVYVRALGSGYGMGWFFRKWNDTPVELDHCVVNAAGSTSFKGVSLVNAPETVIQNCTFLNFPKEDGRAYGAAIQEEVVGEPVNDHRLFVERSAFDNSFTNAYAIARLGTGSTVTFTDVLAPAELSGVHAPDVVGNLIVASNCVAWSGHSIAGNPASEQGFGALAAIGEGATSDMDGDGLSDFDEAYVYGTNPLDSDSDGDGIDDYAEIVTSHTDPTDPLSHLVEIRLSVTNIVPSVVRPIYYGLSRTDIGWDVDDAWLYSEASATNVIVRETDGWYAKAFIDVNSNGFYDESVDVLTVEHITAKNAVVSKRLEVGDWDRDGVCDVTERADETDPYSKLSLRIRREVLLSNADYGSMFTNYYNVSTMPGVPSTPNDMDSFLRLSVGIQVDDRAQDGCLHLNVFRDFNRNGVYDEGTDAYYHLKIVNSSTSAVQELVLGDLDNDGMSDSVEIEDGTSWSDAESYLYSGVVNIAEIFATSNALTCVGYLGTNVIYGPVAIQSRLLSGPIAGRGTSSRERLRFSFSDGANETSVELSPKDVRDERYLALPMGRFDSDANGMLDFWEQEYSLAGGPYDDPDGDGVVNLHEFYARTSPAVSNEMDSALSVMRRSIDSRIEGKSLTAKSKISNYSENRFQLNQGFWAADVDTTGVSFWNQTGGRLRAGTLISPRHIVFAKHFQIAKDRYVRFWGRDGNVYSNKLVNAMFVKGTDIMIGALDEDVPSVVSHLRILPTNFMEYASVAEGVPVLQFDYDEHGLVVDIAAKISTTVSTGIPRGANRQCFYENVIEGDSGNPVLAIIGDEAALLGTLHTGRNSVRDKVYEGGNAPFLTWYAKDVQRVMDELAPGYQLEFIDMSMFDKLDGYEELSHDN